MNLVKCDNHRWASYHILVLKHSVLGAYLWREDSLAHPWNEIGAISRQTISKISPYIPFATFYVWQVMQKVLQVRLIKHTGLDKSATIVAYFARIAWRRGVYGKREVENRCKFHISSMQCNVLDYPSMDKRSHWNRCDNNHHYQPNRDNHPSNCSAHSKPSSLTRNCSPLPSIFR